MTTLGWAGFFGSGRSYICWGSTGSHSGSGVAVGYSPVRYVSGPTRSLGVTRALRLGGTPVLWRSDRTRDLADAIALALPSTSKPAANQHRPCSLGPGTANGCPISSPR